MPLLEALAEGFFWNLLEFGHHIRFDVLHVCEMHPLEAHFQSREQPKLTRSEIQRVQWLGDDDRNAFLGEETRFAPMEDIRSNAMAELRKIPKEALRRCFQQRQDRWSKCVCARKGPTLKVIR